MKLLNAMYCSDSYVKVCDALPENGIKVICVTKNSKGIVNYAISEMYEFNGKKCWKGSKYFTDTIIAWKHIDPYIE